MKRFGIFLVMLALSSLACKAIFGNGSQPPDQAPAGQATNPPSEGQAPAQPPVIQLPNLTGVQLGDEVRNERCGYSFRKIPDYKLDQTAGVDTMTPPGATTYGGQGIMFICGARNTASTNEDVIRELTTGLTLNATGTPEASGLTYSNQRNVRIGGVNAISVDIGGTGKGREVVAMVTPHRLLMVVGMALTDKWEAMRPYFEAVVNSITFFEPTTTPTANP
jgi:hypothetical protein